MKARVAKLASPPLYMFMCFLFTGCAASNNWKAWSWPWNSNEALSAADPAATAATPTPFTPVSMPTEWPDEKKAASDLKLALAKMVDQQGSIDEAIGNYEQMLGSDPQNLALIRRVAVLYDKKGQPDKSEPFYQRALLAGANDASLLCDYGYHCYLQRRWADAEVHLRKSLEMDSHQSRARGNLALVLARTQRIEEALQQFAEAGCTRADAHANVAFALASEAQLESAEQQYRQALAADPQHKRAREALTALDQARKQSTTKPS